MGGLEDRRSGMGMRQPLTTDFGIEIQNGL